ncbi:hypothetical protein [Pseudomonas sessilinigenes]|uniref:Uncharacterized protein n=1 Tax=Pseudomonas sessilinigenes TaxID=658629 RepID=A0ABX8MLE3_9PSED|nr:hypothetical protein [Pseudomonas sessilinigenes]AZC26536.1 hypothetical protein C4K39_4891 [Pseudomonas sessilinigenes]QXH39458.1 hypothetical protein KSS89_25045 [Pseudomonas sessilinigenes]
MQGPFEVFRSCYSSMPLQAMRQARRRSPLLKPIAHSNAMSWSSFYVDRRMLAGARLRSTSIASSQAAGAL